jgi:Fe2+ or Zn2+ uptake regulation protein
MRPNIYKNKIVQLFETNHLLNIADLHKKISGADYSTIYRNVEQLVEEKKLRKIVIDKEKIMYERDCKENQHDHFVCVDCGDIESIDASHENVSLAGNYIINDLLVRGLCGSCNSKI